MRFFPKHAKKKNALIAWLSSLRGLSQERDLRFAWLVAHDAGRRIDHEPHLISLNVDAANADDGRDIYLHSPTGAPLHPDAWRKSRA